MACKLCAELLDNILDQVISYEMAQPSDRWLLAVSGGADSMAMLRALAELRTTGRLALAGLEVAHLNHQLRGMESDTDAAFVVEQAQSVGLRCTLGSSDIGDEARRQKTSVETTARAQRYRFLVETAAARDCGKLALAHNADDNIETMLHRITRGTGIRGLAGIPATRPLQRDGAEVLIVRPLLGVRREGIEHYLQHHRIPYRIDSSNLSKTPTRNRIRHDLIPMLAQQFNPNIFGALQRLRQTAEWMAEAMRDDIEAKRVALTISQADERLVLDAEQMRRLTRIEQGEVLHQALQALGMPLQPIGYRQVVGIMRRLERAQGPEWSLQGPRTLQVKGTNKELVLEMARPPQAVRPALEPLALATPGRTTLPDGYLSFDPHDLECHPVNQVEIEPKSMASDLLERFQRDKDYLEELVDRDRIEGDLQVRPWQRGERFKPLGAPGEKTLGDFFTDQKVPRHDRDRMALVADETGVVWIPGLRIADRVKVNQSSRSVLKLTAS